jgi:hypothetical protein
VQDDERSISRRIAELLISLGIENVLDLAQVEPPTLRRRMEETGITRELPGEPPVEAWVYEAREVVDRGALPQASREHYDLLQTADVTSYGDLSQAEVEQLSEALEAVNQQYHLVAEVPDRFVLQGWISRASEVMEHLERFHDPIAPFLAGLPGRKKGPIIRRP